MFTHFGRRRNEKKELTLSAPAGDWENLYVLLHRYLCLYINVLRKHNGAALKQYQKCGAISFQIMNLPRLLYWARTLGLRSEILLEIFYFPFVYCYFDPGKGENVSGGRPYLTEGTFFQEGIVFGRGSLPERCTCSSQRNRQCGRCEKAGSHGTHFIPCNVLDEISVFYPPHFPV